MYFNSNDRRNNNNKTMAEMERQQEKLVKMYNNVFHAISNMKTAKDYLATRNLLNVFSSEEGVNTLDIYKLRKMLDKKVVELLEANEKQMQNIQKDIDNIKSIKVEESMEQLKKLEYESNNVLYSYMAQLHTNGIQENSDRRRIGCWCKEPTRIEAVALVKLSSLPQYSNYFTERQRKVIVENAKNPDAVKHERSMQPLLEQKQRELSKLYMEGFQLRNIRKKVSNDLKDTIKEG
ncbi:Uncharacterised protein [[Ruminococcus] torques]|uniref:Uncharacterized protein n=1 Tax=[Ruminococcus] torques TaxID=33039 RepID=A0A564SD96_9FIRM|nr:hypothetical protein [[Ruminococcus] torques]VUW92560.1 Uncharacterised protein [[Ruminococcus] torques]